MTTSAEDFKVSYVVPCFNRTKQLRETLLSIINQEDWNSEIIVVDDASTVDTFEPISDLVELAEIHYVKLDRNLGVCGAKNAGVKKAKGELVVFVDSDDLLCQNASTRIRRRFKERPGEVLFFSCVDEERRSIYRRNVRFGRLNYSSLLADEAPGEFLPAAPKALLEAVPFEEHLRGFEHITWLKCARKCGGVSYYPDIARIYRISGEDRMCAPKNLFAGADRLARGWIAYLNEFEEDLARHARLRLAAGIVKALVYGKASGVAERYKPRNLLAKILNEVLVVSFSIIPEGLTRRILRYRMGA
jgi:glycosyltransferase involved in cell wall biosynthesis